MMNLNLLILLTVKSCFFISAIPDTKLISPNHEVHPQNKDTGKIPFRVELKNITPINPGSLYNHCEIEIGDGQAIPLPKTLWQDKYAWSRDFEKLILVKWHSLGKLSVFQFVMIDIKTKSMKESIKMAGAINSLEVKGDSILYKKALFNKVIEEVYVVE